MWNLGVLQGLGSDEIAVLYAFVKKLSLDASRCGKARERGRELREQSPFPLQLDGFLIMAQVYRSHCEVTPSWQDPLILCSEGPIISWLGEACGHWYQPRSVYNTVKCDVSLSFQVLFASRSICPISWRAGGCWAVDCVSCGLWWTTCCARLLSSISS